MPDMTPNTRKYCLPLLARHVTGRSGCAIYRLPDGSLVVSVETMRVPDGLGYDHRLEHPAITQKVARGFLRETYPDAELGAYLGARPMRDSAPWRYWAVAGPVAEPRPAD